MAEDGTLAASENSRHPAPFVADFWTPHRKDTSTNRMEQTLVEAMIDCVAPISERAKLIPRHNAVLAPH